MAKQNVSRLEDLKSQLSALNCELLEDDSEEASRFYILDRKVSVCMTIDDVCDWIDSESEKPAATTPHEAGGSTDAAAPPDDTTVDVNPIRLFIESTIWERGGCYCASETAQRGLALVFAMSAECKGADDNPTLQLDLEDCHAVLQFVTARETSPNVSAIEWYSDDPAAFGLYKILAHVRSQIAGLVVTAKSDTIRTLRAARAARKVIRLYRADGWDALAGERDGKYTPLAALEEALGELQTVLTD